MRVSIHTVPWVVGFLAAPFSAWMGFGLILSFFVSFFFLFVAWVINVLSIFPKKGGPKYIFETIPPSHYCEKARWCLDRLNVPYVEVQDIGILGIMFFGRTVPLLRLPYSKTSVGNSPDILRYLYGISPSFTKDGQPAEWLKPTKESLEWETKFDLMGVAIQRWGYSFLLPHRETCLRFWGIYQPQVPAFQKVLLKALFPVARMFLIKGLGINPKLVGRANVTIEETLRSVEELLADDRKYLLNTPEITYVDITLASLGAFLFGVPKEYCSTTLAPESRPEIPLLPAEMQKILLGHQEKYPRTYAYINRLFAEDRYVK